MLKVYCHASEKAVTKLLYFAQDGKSFIWPNRRYTYTSQLIYKKSGKNNKNFIWKNKFTIQLKSYLSWISYEKRDNKRVSHFLFYLPTFRFLHEINQRFDKIIAITKTSSILSQWTYFSSQTFQKIQCNVSGTFVLNYYLLQTLIKVSINLRDRRKISVMKLVFIENQGKLETYYIFWIIVKDHKFSRFFKINFRHKTNFLQRFLS